MTYTGIARGFPIVKEQTYRFEPKKIYKLEMRTRPKKTKKDSYIKDCKEQPREICNQWNIQLPLLCKHAEEDDPQLRDRLRKLEPMLEFATK